MKYTLKIIFKNIENALGRLIKFYLLNMLDGRKKYNQFLIYNIRSDNIKIRNILHSQLINVQSGNCSYLYKENSTKILRKFVNSHEIKNDYKMRYRRYQYFNLITGVWKNNILDSYGIKQPINELQIQLQLYYNEKKRPNKGTHCFEY